MQNMESQGTLADDLIEGVPNIATFLYGRADGQTIRRVHYLLETKRIPAGKIGNRWISYKSKLRAAFDSVIDGAA